MRSFAEVFIYVFGYLVAKVLTDLLKVYAGRLRPDFIARCQPDYSKAAFPDDPTVFIAEDICTGDAHEILEGRKSHPSGHAMGATFAAVYVMVSYIVHVKHKNKRRSRDAHC